MCNRTTLFLCMLHNMSYSAFFFNLLTNKKQNQLRILFIPHPKCSLGDEWSSLMSTQEQLFFQFNKYLNKPMGLLTLILLSEHTKLFPKSLGQSMFIQVFILTRWQVHFDKFACSWSTRMLVHMFNSITLNFYMFVTGKN